jgi:site-specific DNA recombinase
MAQNGEFDVLVVRELDRLSRNLAKQLIVEEELKRGGVRIEYALSEYPDTPEGNLQKHIKATIAEYEREKTKERTMRGRRNKVKSGKLLGNCLPYGLKNIGEKGKDKIIVDEKEAKIIQQIFHWFLTKKTSMRQIASWLTDKQVPVPGLAYNRPGAGVWVSSTVRRILSNKSYIGQFTYSGIEVNKPELAIVGEEDFSLAQDILSNNRHWRRRKGRDATPGRYLLLDHIYCSCGYRMTGRTLSQKNKKAYYYYSCVTKSYPKQKDPCPEPMIRGIKADQIVWEWLKALLSMDEARLRKGLDELAHTKEDGMESKHNRIKAIDSQMANISNKIGGLMRAFGGDDDPDVTAQLKTQVDQLKKTKKDLQSQRERVVAEISVNTVTSEQIDNIVTFAEKIRGKMERANYENKRELIDTLNVHIDMAGTGDNRRMDMSCDLPGSDYSEVIGLRRSYSSNR